MPHQRARETCAHQQQSTAGVVPCRLGPEAEFLLLMDLKARTEARLDALVAIIDPGVPHLPMAGLRGLHPTVLLFKGGNNV